jgi:membrane protein
LKPLKNFYELLLKGEIQLVAAALSFSTVLSLIPFLAVSLATIQYINGFEAMYPKVEALTLEYFQGPMGAEGVQFIRKVFTRVQAGRMGTAGALALILASILLINNMEKGIHRIWGLPSRRPLIQRIFYYWIALLLFPAGLAVYVAISSMKFLSAAATIVPNYWVNYSILFLVLYFVYKVVPNTKVSIGAAGVGAISGTIGLTALFRSFKWLSQSFFSWGKLYGSFAAIPALLLWILLTWYVILIGAAITASFRRT